MSREDHRRYDALLEKVRQMERSITKKDHSTLDPGWFLAAVMALGLFVLAQKVGRGVTAVVLITMVAMLVGPIWKLGLVRHATTRGRKIVRFTGVMLVALALVSLFGAYVWPPIKRHTLTAKELASFDNALKTQKGDDIEIRLACPPNDEKGCTYAGQFIRPIGDSGWKVQAYVDRLMLTKPLDGIMIYRRGGNRDYTLKHYDAGGFFNSNEPHLLAMQKGLPINSD
jgi:hypothetical protein